MIWTTRSFSVFCIILPCWAQFLDSSNVGLQCSVSILPKNVNEFGVYLTQALRGYNNIFISPLSIYTVLTMVYLGTSGQTSKQLGKTLQIPENRPNQIEFYESFKNILDTINTKTHKYKLLVGNGMFLQNNYDINQYYLDEIQRFYGALLQYVNFQTNEETARKKINEFIAENTLNKVKHSVKKPFDASTILVLVNTIYFKGIWKIQFPETETRFGNFYKNNNALKKVKYMTLKDQTFQYFDDYNNNYKFLKLPYIGNDISMLFALPHNKEFPNIDMTPEFLCELKFNMRNIRLKTIKIPKFQFKYEKELSEVLKQLGIKDLFTNAANLTRMFNAKNAKVSSVMHEAVIEVNEQGTEAAAVTRVGILPVAAFPTFDFIADHSFTFYIIDNRNELILFSGRVTDP